MDYMKYFFNIYTEENIKLKREIVEDIIKDLLISRKVTDISAFNNMAGALKRASQISNKEILNIYYKLAVKYGIKNDIINFYESNSKDLLDKTLLTWQQVQKLFHNKIIKAKIMNYHINGRFRVADNLIVLGILDSKDVEEAKSFCGNNEVIAYTMNSELKF